MPIGSRATRAAQELLRVERRIPVPIEKIAKKYALILKEALPDDISGMLIPLPDNAGAHKWAIVVNATDAKVRQRFTIAHELGHLLMHRYSSPHADGRLQVRFRNAKSASGRVREEIEANQFAAEVLMPERFVKVSASRLRYDLVDSAFDDDALKSIQRLADRLQVSAQALSFRIANLGMG